MAEQTDTFTPNLGGTKGFTPNVGGTKGFTPNVGDSESFTPKTSETTYSPSTKSTTFNPGGQEMSTDKSGVAKRFKSITEGKKLWDNFLAEEGKAMGIRPRSDAVQQFASYINPVLSYTTGVLETVKTAQVLNEYRDQFTPEEQMEFNIELGKATVKKAGEELFWRYGFGALTDTILGVKSAGQVLVENKRAGVEGIKSVVDKSKNTLALINNGKETPMKLATDKAGEVTFMASNPAQVHWYVKNTKEVAKTLQPYTLGDDKATMGAYDWVIRQVGFQVADDATRTIGTLKADTVPKESIEGLTKYFANKQKVSPDMIMLKLSKDGTKYEVQQAFRPERDIFLPTREATDKMRTYMSMNKQKILDLKKKFNVGTNDMDDLYGAMTGVPSKDPRINNAATELRTEMDRLFGEFGVKNYRKEYLPKKTLEHSSVKQMDLPDEIKSFFKMERSDKELLNQSHSVFDLIDYYITAGSKEKFLSPVYEASKKMVAEQKYPKEIANFIDDYYKGVLGKAPELDTAIAQKINSVLGNLRTAPGVTAAHVEQVSQLLTNQVYLSTLFARPYSAVTAAISNTVNTYTMLGAKYTGIGTARFAAMNLGKDPMAFRLLKGSGLTRDFVEGLRSAAGETGAVGNILKGQEALLKVGMQGVSAPDQIARAVGYLGGFTKAERAITKFNKGLMTEKQVIKELNLGMFSRAQTETLVNRLRSKDVFHFSSTYAKYIPDSSIFVFGGGETAQVARSAIGKPAYALLSYVQNYTNMMYKLVRAAKNGDAAPLSRMVAGSTIAIMGGKTVGLKLWNQLGFGAMPTSLITPVPKLAWEGVKGVRNIGMAPFDPEVDTFDVIGDNLLGGVGNVAKFMTPGALTMQEVGTAYENAGGDPVETIGRWLLNNKE